MTTIALVTMQKKSQHLPDWALVLGFSLTGLLASLVLAVTTSPDGLVSWF
jgi:hypothetical protein